MDWDKLKIFHAVAEAGSFTSATINLNLSQSAISRQIQALEDDLKVKLFERHARGLTLTENGEYVFKTAHEVISKLKEVETTLGDKKTKPSGKLTVTTVVSFGTTWLTPRIQEFMQLNPEIEVELIFDDKELDLSTRQADIGIFMRRPKQLNYIQKKLIDINYHIYGSPKYLEKHGYPKTINDLNKHKFISFGRGAPSPVYDPDWALKLGMKDVIVINPGCNYPINVSEEAKEFARSIYGNSSPKLITVSRLDGRKSHQNILMTVKNLLPKFPNLKYVSIGDGDEKKNLLKLRKELSLENNVELLFKSTEQEKVALLEQSNVFVMPSVIYKKSVEGFGITYIEAASYGKPSIGGIYGGEGDAIKSGQTGYLCNGNDLNAIYDTLLKTLDNDHYLKLGANALEFSKDFSWEKIVKKYINLI